MNRTSLAIRGLSESELRGPRVRILSGRWAGQEGHLMDGDYGSDGRGVKLDPQAPDGQGTYVEVQPGNYQLQGCE